MIASFVNDNNSSYSTNNKPEVVPSQLLAPFALMLLM